MNVTLIGAVMSMAALLSTVDAAAQTLVPLHDQQQQIINDVVLARTLISDCPALEYREALAYGTLATVDLQPEDAEISGRFPAMVRGALAKAKETRAGTPRGQRCEYVRERFGANGFIIAGLAAEAARGQTGIATSADKLALNNFLAEAESIDRMWQRGTIDTSIVRTRWLTKVDGLRAETKEGPMRAAQLHCAAAGQALANALLTDRQKGRLAAEGERREFVRYASECRKRVR